MKFRRQLQLIIQKKANPPSRTTQQTSDSVAARAQTIPACRTRHQRCSSIAPTRTWICAENTSTAVLRNQLFQNTKLLSLPFRIARQQHRENGRIVWVVEAQLESDRWSVVICDSKALIFYKKSDAQKILHILLQPESDGGQGFKSFSVDL